MNKAASETSKQDTTPINEPIDTSTRENIAFVGETLGPFFLVDPSSESIRPAFTAIKDLDAKAGASDWPFVEDQSAYESLELMQQGLGVADKDPINDELIWEYRRLFIGPAKKPAPPWGSVYTDSDGVVFGASTLAFRQWMRENGIGRTTADNTPEDHIGLMLMLMSWMAENKPEILEEYLRLHLLTWSSHFLEQLEAVAEQPFYKALAKLTKASLEGIQAKLNIQVEYPRFYR